MKFEQPLARLLGPAVEAIRGQWLAPKPLECRVREPHRLSQVAHRPRSKGVASLALEPRYVGRGVRSQHEQLAIATEHIPSAAADPGEKVAQAVAPRRGRHVWPEDLDQLVHVH